MRSRFWMGMLAGMVVSRIMSSAPMSWSLSIFEYILLLAFGMAIIGIANDGDNIAKINTFAPYWGFLSIVLMHDK